MPVVCPAHQLQVVDRVAAAEGVRAAVVELELPPGRATPPAMVEEAALAAVALVDCPAHRRRHVAADGVRVGPEERPSRCDSFREAARLESLKGFGHGRVDRLGQIHLRQAEQVTQSVELVPQRAVRGELDAIASGGGGLDAGGRRRQGPVRYG